MADDVVNPATEAVLAGWGAAASPTPRPPWPRHERPSTTGRGPGAPAGSEREHIRRLHDVLAERIDAIAALVVAEVGTTVAATRSHQVGLPIEHLDYWADAAARPGARPPPAGGHAPQRRHVVARELGRAS